MIIGAMEENGRVKIESIFSSCIQANNKAACAPFSEKKQETIENEKAHVASDASLKK